MNKQDLIDSLAKEKEISRLEAKKVINLVFQSTTDTLAQGDRVEVRGLGTFMFRHYDAYHGRNPKTGERVKIKAKKLPFFKCDAERN